LRRWSQPQKESDIAEPSDGITMNESPKFLELNAIEETLLQAKLDAVRAAIDHAAKKGRALEHGVRSLLRSILPTEYGLSTGFMVYHGEEGPRLSSQLDIIIYDAVRSGPIISLETCDVFPLEAVYGYVEVKAGIRSSSDDAAMLADNSIEACLKKNHALRSTPKRRFHIPTGDSPVKAKLIHWDVPSIRSYVFAFESLDSVTKDLDKLAQRMADYMKRLGNPTHLHGLFIGGKGFLRTNPVDEETAPPEDWFHTENTTDHPLLTFKTSILQDLARFPRPEMNWAPAIEQYFPKPAWKSFKPLC
jgi:hypothetical protein